MLNTLGWGCWGSGLQGRAAAPKPSPAARIYDKSWQGPRAGRGQGSTSWLSLLEPQTMGSKLPGNSQWAVLSWAKQVTWAQASILLGSTFLYPSEAFQKVHG